MLLNVQTLVVLWQRLVADTAPIVNFKRLIARLLYAFQDALQLVRLIGSLTLSPALFDKIRQVLIHVQ